MTDTPEDKGSKPADAEPSPPAAEPAPAESAAAESAAAGPAPAEPAPAEPAPSATAEPATPAAAPSEPGSASTNPPDAGYPPPGYSQAGYPQAGYPQSDYAQSDYAQPGFPPPPGYVPPGHPQPGYPSYPDGGGYPQGGYPQPGYPQAYPPAGYPAYPPPPPQPGTIALRPLQLGDLYSGAMRAIRQNAAVLFGLSLIAMLIIVVVQVVQVTLQFTALGRPSGAGVFAMSIGSAFVSLFVGIAVAVAFSILNGMQVVVQVRAALGRRTSFAQAWERVSPKIAGLVGVSLLTSVISVGITIVGLVVVALVGLFATSGAAMGAITFLVIIVVLIASIYVGVLLVFATSAYVLENIGIVDALRRSRDLVTGQWWRIFGILLLTGLMVGVIAFVVLIPFTIAGAFATYTNGSQAGVGAAVLLFVGFVVVGTVLLPFMIGVINLLYVDARIRRERFDMELARAAAEGTEL